MRLWKKQSFPQGDSGAETTIAQQRTQQGAVQMKKGLAEHAS